ncbi:hypothetical protein ACT7LO_004322 [Providencia rettgeri]|uniref:hypothetical protein n=1 Tax=Providencia huaxiensis TaxID=2027290 RepID=UPI0034DCF962
MIKKILAVLVVLIIAISVFAYNKITIFTVQPIGAIPDGVTIVMWKKGDMRFFESPDGLCMQRVGNVSLLCRMSMLGGAVDKDNIIMRLPYSEYAYLKSTNDRKFDR